MKLGKLLAGALLTAAAASSHAGLLYIDGGDETTFASNNDYVSMLPDPAPNYWVGADLYASADVSLEFTYFGSEAGYSNSFYYGADQLFDNSPRNPNPYEVSGVTGYAGMDQLLDVSFMTNMGSNNTADDVTIANGDDQSNSLQTIAVMLDTMWNGVEYSALLFWDDSGAGPDDNHDDMVIGIQAVAVPEPSTLALMGLGLLGLGAARRRQA